MENKKYTCPCCGYKVFEDAPGSDDICPVCFWHDDIIDLQTMYEPVGPNKVSLEQAQKNYVEFGAKEKRLVEVVCPPTNLEKDKVWRMLDKKKDMPKDIDPYATDPKGIYYWYWN